MKIFLYKSLIVFIGIFLLFEFTVGKQIKSFERKMYSAVSSDNIYILKEKIRSELKEIDDKKRLLSEEDAFLLNRFLEKIASELKSY